MAETTWTSEAEGLALLLKEREPGYRALAASLPGGAVFVVDRGLRYLLAEGEALRDAGFTSADFEGKTVLEATADPLAAEYEANIRRVLAGEEFRHEHQAHGRYFSSRGTPLRDDAGEICAALVVSYDVTGQKRAEEELREAEERQRFLLELSDALRPLSEPSNIAALATERLGERFGMSRVFYAEIEDARMTVERDYAHGVDSIVGEHDLSAFGPELLAAYRDGTIVTVDDVATDPRFGEEARAGLLSRKVGAYVDVVLFRRGQSVGLLAVQSATPRRWTQAEKGLFQDFGERVRFAIERARAEAAVRRSEERYRALVAASSDVAYCLSPDWSLLQPLDGRGLVPSNSQPIRDWLPRNVYAEDLAHVRTVIDAAIANKTVFELEHRVNRPDGSVGWTLSRAVPILDDHGDIAEWFGAASDITERKRAEEALAASAVEINRQRRFYETILDSTPDLVYVFGLDHRFTYANDVLLRMWGKTWEEAIGRNCLELGYEPWHAEMHDREIEMVVATKGPIRGVVPFEGTFGRRIYDYIFVPVFDEQGDVIAVAGTTRDVTDMRRAEEALRESEERFRGMADHAPMMVWVTQADGSCTYLSQSWYEFTGQTLETGLGYGWIQALHPDDREKAEREFIEANRDRRAFMVEYRLRRADGQYRWAIDSAKPRLGPAGEYLGYVGSVIDITERKEAEEVLRRSEERFRVMTDAVPQIVWIIDPEGRVEFFNRQWYEYTGTSTTPATSREVAENHVHPDDVETTMQRFEESAKTRSGFSVEHRIRSAAGEYRWFLVRAEPYQDPETGDIVRWYGSSTDIHDSKLKDEALQRANEALEARVDERTRELLEKNLELEGFTYSVSHDMRAPLRAIVSNAQITLEDEGPNVSPEGRERLERLSKASMRMAELIDDLLQYARLGTRQLRIEKIDLAELGRQTARDVSADRGDCELQLTADGPLWVECDPRLIGMALHNLLDNACKYRTAGETAQVELRSEDRNGETVYFVKDRGIGFDMAYVGKLFQAFERLHREEYTGTGIGLANVKRAVQRHGGRVWAESEGPGKGATFFFTLG